MEGSVPAACYIRVSTEDQTEYSPDAQRKALEAYARQHGMTIDPAHVYIDAGISGRKAVTRPAFMEMIGAAKRRPPPFSVILVHKLDRFARNREDSIVYKSMLRRQCGVRVISVTEHLEDDRMGLILEAMLEAMAEYYSINLGDEVRKGMAEKARRGELQTSPPFGYRAEGNRLVPVPREAETVRELFRRVLDGASIASLARWAGERGALSHRGNPLDSRGIRYILSNPVYIGLLRWGTGEGERSLTEGGHPPLIDGETFQRVRVLLEANQTRYGSHARPPGERKHWLSGLVKCAVCGGGLICSGSGCLRCGRYVKGKCETSQHVPAARLETAVLTRLREDAKGEGRLILTPVKGRKGQRNDDLERTLAAEERKLVRLREAYLCGAETAEEYRDEKARLVRRIGELRSRREAEEREERPLPSPEELRDAADLPDFPFASAEDRFRAAAAVLSACVWDRERGTVTLIYRWGGKDGKNPERKGKYMKNPLETRTGM